MKTLLTLLGRCSKLVNLINTYSLIFISCFEFNLIILYLDI